MNGDRQVHPSLFHFAIMLSRDALRGAFQLLRHLHPDEEAGAVRLTPALCHLDYTMSDAGGASSFVREYTLASGGPYCDCGYKRKAGK